MANPGQRDTLFYLLTISGFSALIYAVLQAGKQLEHTATISANGNAWQDFLAALQTGLHAPLTLLLAQMAVILVAARAAGWLFQKLGQPTVVGEMAAGIVLGPSLLGRYWPEAMTALFPAKSLDNLKFVSQIGMLLFMFVVGLELDLSSLRGKAHRAVVISHASIVVPFSLGLGLAYFLYEEWAPAGVGFAAFGLFMGIAMSITAFPVLARIVRDRGLTGTPLGTLVITCAAADDVTAWCLLAAVVALVKAGSFVSTLYIVALAALYVLLMLRGVRPLLARLVRRAGGVLTLSSLTAFFFTLVLSALLAEVIGIHSLFGAFLAGAILPADEQLRETVRNKVQDVAVLLLLPLFFVFTGLRTEIGLLGAGGAWLVGGAILLVAVVGKFLGSAVAARAVGYGWPDSLSVGALMNTRGLMELVVLNIGYDLGILSPAIFTLMVLMALLTTCMAGPALDLIRRLTPKATAVSQ